MERKESMSSMRDSREGNLPHRTLSRTASMGNMNHEPTALEQKMNVMRQKFMMLQMMEEAENKVENDHDDGSASSSVKVSKPPAATTDNISSSQPPAVVRSMLSIDMASIKRASTAPGNDTETIREESTPSSPRAQSATQRWSKLRKIVRSDNAVGVIDKLRTGLHMRSIPATPEESPRAMESPRASFLRTNQAQLELEDIKLMDIWGNPDYAKSFNVEEALKPDVTLPAERTDIDTEFDSGTEEVKIEVNRIPEEYVTIKKDAAEQAMYEQHKKTLDDVKKLKMDTVWRENLARKRVEEMELESKKRLQVEKSKIVELAAEKESAIARDFRKAREELEMGIRRQQGAVKEHFGKILIHNESLARRFHVFTRMFPQPVEFRIHLMRAVKNKLPKGAYCLMLTQYDSLGGHPLAWSSMGATGIGAIRPGITRIVKHMGRFYDRTLRFEDSCFALCPPRPMLKPGFSFVLELFQLASHRNPIDKIVAWTAVPMSFESMSIVEGKLKLPMLRGQHSPAIQHYRTMERCIASDLDNWLCNIYIEVRHMSLHELGATETMLKSADFDLDYLNKVVVSDSSLHKSTFHEPVTPGLSESPLAAKNNIMFQEQRKSQKMVPFDNAVDEDVHKEIEEQLDQLEKGTIAVKEKPSLQMPVDKGVFRRKLNANVTPLIIPKDGDTVAVTAGGGLAGTGGVSGKAPVLHESTDEEEGKRSKLETSKKGTIASNLWGMLGYKSTQQSSSFSSSNAALTKDISFEQHRMELIKQWKSNIKNKHLSSFDVDDPRNNDTSPEVRERGYNLQDEVFLHQQQRGKLAGIETINSAESRKWAGAGLEGKIVRRWQSEGPRFDSDAIEGADANLSPIPSPMVRANGGQYFSFDSKQGWEELRDNREIIEYSMSIASDPTQRKHLMPGSKARSKLRYLSRELFGDLVPYLFGSFDFYMTLSIYLFVFWMRIYVHYLAQYLFVLAQNTPVYGFDMNFLFISFRYSSASLSTAVEVGIVSIGPIACICIFLLCLIFGGAFYKLTGFLPDVFSKFFAYYGVATVLDPALIFLIDLIYHHYHCETISDICEIDYTNRNCNCYDGDFIKLWNRMLRLEGSGITGAFITIMVYLACSVLSALALYEYLIYVHRDGRILDLWRRGNAPEEEFFVPDDFEVGAAELKLIVSKARAYRGMSGTRRKVVTQEGVERDPDDTNFMGKFKRFLIYEVDSGGKSRSLFRQFLLDSTGKIVEIFEDAVLKAKTGNLFRIQGLGDDTNNEEEGDEDHGGEGGSKPHEEEDNAENDNDEQSMDDDPENPRVPLLNRHRNNDAEGRSVTSHQSTMS